MTRTGILKRVIFGGNVVSYTLIRCKRKNPKSADDFVFTDLCIDEGSIRLADAVKWFGKRIRVSGPMLPNGLLQVYSMGIAPSERATK